MHKAVKTLEFKLTLNDGEAAMIDRWLDAQRWVWNQGLELLKEFEAFSHYNKHDKAHAPCCPVPWEYRWQKGDNEEWVAIPFSRILVSRKGGLCCPLPQGYRQPRIDRDSEYSLTPLFAYKLHEDKPWLRECPYKLTQGTIKALATAWAEYRKGKRKSPKFKRRGEVSTLSDTQSGNARVDGGYLKLPKLGVLRVRSLEKRWPEGVQVKTYRILKQPSGYYLLLVGEMPTEQPKPTDKVCGFDAGVTHILNDDAGKHIDIPLPLERRLKLLRRLQQKASRQQKGSANQRKTYARIAQVHERIRRERKGWHHKLTTFAVRKFDGIAVEKLNLAALSKRPKPKLKEDGSGYEHNMATAKSGLNRKLRDAGIGAMYTMLESKAKAFGRRFERVPPAYTSQKCNACGVVDKASRKGEVFRCTSCGHTDHADTNAAKNIRAIAFPEEGVGAAWAGRKPAESDRVQTVKQEGAKASPDGDAIPTPKERKSRESGDAKRRKPRNSVAPKGRKRRSAKTVAETPLQLSFWDAAPAPG